MHQEVIDHPDDYSPVDVYKYSGSRPESIDDVNKNNKFEQDAKIANKIGLAAVTAPYAIAYAPQALANPMIQPIAKSMMIGMGADAVSELITDKPVAEHTKDAVQYATGLDPRNNAVSNFALDTFGNPFYGFTAESAKMWAGLANKAGQFGNRMINTDKRLINNSPVGKSTSKKQISNGPDEDLNVTKFVNATEDEINKLTELISKPQSELTKEDIELLKRMGGYNPDNVGIFGNAHQQIALNTLEDITRYKTGAKNYEDLLMRNPSENNSVFFDKAKEDMKDLFDSEEFKERFVNNPYVQKETRNNLEREQWYEGYTSLNKNNIDNTRYTESPTVVIKRGDEYFEITNALGATENSRADIEIPRNVIVKGDDVNKFNTVRHETTHASDPQSVDNFNKELNNIKVKPELRGDKHAEYMESLAEKRARCLEVARDMQRYGVNINDEKAVSDFVDNAIKNGTLNINLRQLIDYFEPKDVKKMLLEMLSLGTPISIGINGNSKNE